MVWSLYDLTDDKTVAEYAFDDRNHAFIVSSTQKSMLADKIDDVTRNRQATPLRKSRKWQMSMLRCHSSGWRTTLSMKKYERNLVILNPKLTVNLRTKFGCLSV